MTIFTGTKELAAVEAFNPDSASLGVACCRSRAALAAHGSLASQPVRSLTDRRPGGRSDSRGFLESSEAQGWANMPQPDVPAGQVCSTSVLQPPTPVSGWGWMPPARAGSGSLEAQSLPVGPRLQSQEQPSPTSRPQSHVFLCSKLARAEFNGW